MDWNDVSESNIDQFFHMGQSWQWLRMRWRDELDERYSEYLENTDEEKAKSKVQFGDEDFTLGDFIRDNFYLLNDELEPIFNEFNETRNRILCHFKTEVDYRFEYNNLANKIYDQFAIKPLVSLEYHGTPKNLNNWYLEPDSSIDVIDEYFGVELVTRPYPIKQALDWLESICYFMEDNGIITNNSTGVHVNLSIGNNKIDIVKLFAFFNETYLQDIFNKFGESAYGKSYYSSVLKAMDSNLPNAKTKKDIMGQFTQLFQNKLQAKYRSFNFQKLDDHGVIEFRIIRGNNYFTRYPEIHKMVLQFANLIKIASSDLYDDLYWKKLVKLIHAKNKVEVQDSLKNFPKAQKFIEGLSLSSTKKELYTIISRDKIILQDFIVPVYLDLNEFKNNPKELPTLLYTILMLTTKLKNIGANYKLIITDILKSYKIPLTGSPKIVQKLVELIPNLKPEGK